MLSISRAGGPSPHRHLQAQTRQLQVAVERLSSGLRLNRASDDVAALGFSEGLRAQVRGSHQAAANLQDGLAMLGVADGGLAAIGDLVQRLRELAVAAGNGTYGVSQRNAMQAEANQLRRQINQMVTSSDYNTYKVLEGTVTPAGNTYSATENFARGATSTLTVTRNLLADSPKVSSYVREWDPEIYSTNRFDSTETLLGWSSDDARIGASRYGASYIYGAGGGVGAPLGETLGPLSTSAVIGGDTYTLSNFIAGGGGVPVYNGLYVSKNGGAKKLLKAFTGGSSGLQMSFNSTGSKIALAYSVTNFLGTSSQDIFTLDFHAANYNAAIPTAFAMVANETLINTDGDMLGVPTSYTLGTTAEWFVRADGQTPVKVMVEDYDGNQTRQIFYDATATNGFTLGANGRTLSLHGSGQIDSNDVLRVYYQTDHNMTTNQDGNVSLALSARPETYGFGTTASSIRVETSSGGVIAYDPTRTNGWDYDAATNRVTLYGDKRPVGQDIVQVYFRTDHLGASSNTSADQDGAVEISLFASQRPEVYDLGTPADASMQVLLDAAPVAYDPTHTDGWDYNPATNTVALYGPARPNTYQTLTLRTIQDYGVTTNQDGEVQFQLSPAPDLYHLSDGAFSRAMLVYVGTSTVPLAYDALDGFTYDPATRRVTLHGAARPSTTEGVRVAFISDLTPSNAYTFAIPPGTATYPGTVSVSKGGTPLTQLTATDGSGDGFFLSGGQIGLAGTAAPDAATPTTTYTIGTIQPADNSFSLNAPLASGGPVLYPNDHITSPAETGIDLSTLTVTVDGAAVALDPVDGYTVTATLGPRVGGVQTHTNVQVQLNGASRLLAGPHAVAIDYDYIQLETRVAQDFVFQAGADMGNTRTISLDPVGVSELGLSAFYLHSGALAQDALAKADAALSQISRMRGTIGAAMNSLGSALQVAGTTALNSRAAYSRMRDADVAAELASLTRSRILADAAMAMTAQFHLRDEQLLSVLI